MHFELGIFDEVKHGFVKKLFDFKLGPENSAKFHCFLFKKR